MEAEQTLAPRKHRNDLEPHPQESFHRDETRAIGIAARANDRNFPAVFKYRFSLPAKQIYPSRQVSGPIVIYLLLS